MLWICILLSVQTAYSQSRPSTLRMMLPGNVPLELILVEAGSFMMGSPTEEDELESPQHRVTLTRDYYMGKYEITQAQWKAVMGSNPSEFKSANRPVGEISLNDVLNFVDKLNSLLKTADRFSLPTEAQWEYAARGGKKTKGYRYAGSNNLSQVAWYGEDQDMPHPVGQKQPNELGLYDMSGNVYEWCADDLRGYTTAAVTDPKLPINGFYSIIRGGSWHSPAETCRLAARYDFPLYEPSSIGFRVIFRP